MTTPQTLRRSCAATLVAGLLLGACGGTSNHPVEASDMWSRPTAPGASSAAIYGTLTNTGDTALDLTEMYTAPCGVLEVHDTSMVDGVMEMRPADPDAAVLEPGESLTLEPMGQHVMCLDLKEPMVEDATVPIEFTFDEAGVLAADFVVENRS